MINHLYSEQDQKRIEDRKQHVYENDLRTVFMRDRDRIIHSEAFRRLQNKTQVLFPGEYDFYRTRLTHTIEVGQIGRTIAHYISESSDEFKSKSYVIDQNLIEAICLAHDIGHPPFGHLGEKVFNMIMDGPQIKNRFASHIHLQFKDLLEAVRLETEQFNDKGFEANAQNLRLVENLAFSMGNKGRIGFNTSFATWEGLIKYHHTADYLKKDKLFLQNSGEKFIYDSTYRQYSELQKMFFNHPEELYHEFNFRSIENQIMEMADDIAYSVLDIEDAYKSRFMGLHNIKEIQEYIRDYCSFKNLELPSINGLSLDKIFYKAFSNKVELRKFKNQFITVFITNIIVKKKVSCFDHFKIKGQSERFNFTLDFKYTELHDIMAIFKELVKQFVYTSPHIRQVQHSFPLYILKLFEAYYFNTDLLPRETQNCLPNNLSDEQKNHYKSKRFEVWSKSRIVCDHIAGMTDHYLMKQYRKLFDTDDHRLLDIM